MKRRDSPCGRLSWLPVSFLLHVKYTLSYRIVSYRIASLQYDRLLQIRMADTFTLRCEMNGVVVCNNNKLLINK